MDVVRQVLAREAPVRNDGPHYPLPYTGEGALGLGGWAAAWGKERVAHAFGEEGAFNPRPLLTGRATFEGIRATAPSRWARELVNRTSAPARLSPAPVRADKTKRRDEVFVKMQNLEREVEQLNFSRESAIREEASKSRAVIVEDIMKLVNDRVKADGIDLVIDKSGRSAAGVLALLASKPEMEFTDDLIVALNKSKPAAAAPPAKPSGTKPAAPRKK